MVPKPGYFMDKELKKALLDEYLTQIFRSAGYGGLDLVKTPIGTRITVRALRPGLVIGRKGSKIKSVSKEIEEKFDYPNPAVSVVEVPIPEFEPSIMAWQVARSLSRGYRYRRVGFWVLRSIMEAGAKGAEIVISGKLRTQRSRYEKFTAGVFLKSGDLADKFVKRGKVDVLLKQGMIGVKVLVMPPSPELERHMMVEAKVELEEKGEEQVEAEKIGEVTEE
ncbi:MAG: 30S ribosomal protein S3 [Nitrososphaeria archaeon]|nr:30S ribosomal protein S3 [Nitrososphaeria archaeon]